MNLEDCDSPDKASTAYSKTGIHFDMIALISCWCMIYLHEAKGALKGLNPLQKAVDQLENSVGVAFS